MYFQRGWINSGSTGNRRNYDRRKRILHYCSHITQQSILELKKIYLRNDTLLLKCELEMDARPVRSKIESYSSFRIEKIAKELGERLLDRVLKAYW
ncbi:hypothetical protein CEXT_713241 [Caerostris extrusa]|uniref:Uncharacterized protein n=1 Tax=Caerostris extrusa TaxID=172846 RepID=A0AAV4QPZ6_CAEEX|nr:hypothetical protein CEXT_713241 [Caerostris extrusa]